jgi:CubicO group peptidase (beta-lactamase class C family)
MKRMRAKAVCTVAVVMLLAPTALASRSAQVKNAIRDYERVGQFNGVALVAQGDKVIVRQATGLANLEWKIPNSIDTKFRIGSVTKAFTAILALQLVDRGHLQLDEKLTTYLPQFREKPIGQATIRQLLMHTSGLPDYNKVPPFFRAVQTGNLTREEILTRIGDYELLFEPGKRFNYSNDGYYLLGAAIERVTGKSFERVLTENVLAPVQMASSGYMSRTAVVPKLAEGYRKRLSGIERAPFYEASPASGMYATVDDLYRWYRALAQGRLVSPSTRDLMWTAVPSGNAFGWLVRTDSDAQGRARRRIISEGTVFGFFAWTAYIPDEDATIILLTNMRGPKNYLPVLGQAIIDVLAGRAYTAPRAAIAETLLPIVLAQGAEAAIARYRALKAQPERHDAGEEQLNALGYELLNRERVADAILIFALNAAEHPTSSNAFDSLAEAHMRAGHQQQAIEHYERALALNPNNRNASEMLKKLRK